MSAMTRREALATAGAAAAGTVLAAAGTSAQSQGSAGQGRAVSTSRSAAGAISAFRSRTSSRASRRSASRPSTCCSPRNGTIAAKYGLRARTATPGKGGGTIPDGLNNPALHDEIVATFKGIFPKAKQLKVPNLITFFGNRKGMPDAQAIDNCVAALNRIKPMAEDAQITVIVELLNSKVDHKDYQGDHTPFGVEVVQARRLAARQAAVRHLPHADHGRRCHPHDPGQQAVARALPHRRRPRTPRARRHAGAAMARIAKAIVDSGFTGYFAHEFIPTRDPMTSLREAVVLCDV